jgi:hypothetical protein
MIPYINRLGLLGLLYNTEGVKSMYWRSNNLDYTRNPNSVANHYPLRANYRTSDQSFTVNTGYLEETMTEQVERKLFIPRLFIAQRFTGQFAVIKATIRQLLQWP